MLANALANGFSGFDLLGFVIDFLLNLPAFVLALSVHEAAHAFVAYRCGDPTAKNMGRLTINPLRHLDPTGFLMLMVVGIGYAKPVPVNPNNFRHPRRDDFFVSIAGITANLIMCIVGSIIMFCMIASCIPHIPVDAWQYGLTIQDIFLYAPAIGSSLIEPFLGKTMYYLYEMVVNFTVINLVLALFNLLPIPPLDGYHVFNDLLFKRQLFAPVQAVRIGQGLLLILVVTGWLSKGLNFVISYAFYYIGVAMNWLYSLLFIL